MSKGNICTLAHQVVKSVGLTLLFLIHNPWNPNDSRYKTVCLPAVFFIRRLCGGVAEWPLFFGEEVIVAKGKV